MLRQRLVAIGTAVALLVIAWTLPGVRRRFIAAVVKFDAAPSEPAPLPPVPANSVGLSKVERTRVILIDGLSAEAAQAMPAWRELCKRGASVMVDIGFPSVSLPVEIALWSGLTQQQTGIVVRSDRPLDPPFDARGIPGQSAGSWAIAEDHGWIVRSLGFARVEPLAAPGNSARDADPDAWKARWIPEARTAVAGTTPLVFVHVLRVDTAGHKFGGDSAEYRTAVEEADAILRQLVSAAPDARWFALSDHGHLAHGGHGGEERFVRQVEHCIAGPGVPRVASAQLLHVTDIARAIADSTGTKLEPTSPGRPFAAAVANPLSRDQALPPLPLSAGALAIFALVVGAAVGAWGVRRWWLAPWWFVAAVGALVLVRGEPTLSTPMIYKPEGRDMYLVWLPALALAAVTTFLGRRRATLPQVLAAQLGVPFAAAAAALTASGAWATIFGAEVAPVVPHYTAYASPLLLMAAQASAAVALAVLATAVRPASGRSSRPEPARTEP